MADDKKNISPEVEKIGTVSAQEQPVPENAEPVVEDPAPAEKAVPAEKVEHPVPEAPGPAAPELSRRVLHVDSALQLHYPRIIRFADSI